MHRPDRVTRTWVLALVAVALAGTGMFSVLTTDWDVTIGPHTPLPLTPPTNPIDPDHTLLTALRLVNGVPSDNVGRPAQVAVSADRVFVVDSLATTGMIKIFTHEGNFTSSFGTLSKDGFSMIQDISVDSAGNLVVLDAAPAIYVFDRAGVMLSRLDLTTADHKSELAWAKSIIAVGDSYYILSLEKLFRVDKSGRVTGSFSSPGDAITLGMAPSEYYMGPTGLAVRNGEIWACDSVNGRLVRLGSEGQFDLAVPLPVVNRVKPYPTSLQTDANGNFLLIDVARQVLQCVDISGKTLWEVKLSGAEQHLGTEVADIAVSPHGQVFVSTAVTGLIQTIPLQNDRPGRAVTIIRGRADFTYPLDVAIGSAGLYILATSPTSIDRHQVYLYDPSTKVGKVIVLGEMHSPVRVAVGNGLVYVLDGGHVVGYTPDGQESMTIGDAPLEWGGFAVVDLFGERMGPQGLLVGSNGHIYVADTFQHRIVVFGPKGEFLHQMPLTTDVWPSAMSMAPDGTLLVLNTYGGQVLRLDATGKLVAVYASPGSGFGQLGVVEDMGHLGGPRGLTVDSEGNFYVVDTYNSRIIKFSSTGSVVFAAGHFGSEAGALYLASAIVKSHTAGQFYVVDTYNHRLQLLQLR